MTHKKRLWLERPSLMLFSSLLSIGISACRDARMDPPNIVLISIDTLRGDYFTPENMPLLSEFAEGHCMTYTNAHSNSTWTAPSHATMLTGILQSEHGVEYDSSILPTNLEMVQEKLQQAGYNTVSFTGGGYVNGKRGFSRGFDQWREYSPMRGDMNLHEADFQQEVNWLYEPFAEARELVNKIESPAFIFIHTYAVHEWWISQYPPQAKIADYAPQLYREWIENEDAGARRKIVAEIRRNLRSKTRNKLSPKRRRKLYRSTVSYCDKELIRLLDSIVNSLDNLFVIITSDHGEGFGDKHGKHVCFGHVGNGPYSDQIRIPLIVYGIGSGSTNQLVGLDDIAGTILKLAGLEREPPKSLFRKRDSLVSEYINLRGKDPTRSIAFMTPREKFLLDLDGKLHLYKDPHDKVDLLESIEAETRELTEDVRRELEALGYVQ